MQPHNSFEKIHQGHILKKGNLKRCFSKAKKKISRTNVNVNEKKIVNSKILLIMLIKYTLTVIFNHKID